MPDAARLQRNAACPCGSGKRYKHCCGEVDDVVESRAGPLAPSGAAAHALYTTKRTYVVLGAPRGGTSLLAGALHHAGVHMGKFRTTQYEDPDFKIPPKLASEAPARLAPAIRARNELFGHWGWKVPNSIYYIRRVVHLLVNPVFLFIYRDPLAIARSSAKHDGRDWDAQHQRLLDVAIAHTQRVRQFEESLSAGFHVFQLEDIHTDPAAFIDRFAQMLQPLEVERERLLRFIDRNGGYQ